MRISGRVRKMMAWLTLGGTIEALEMEDMLIVMREETREDTGFRKISTGDVGVIVKNLKF